MEIFLEISIVIAITVVIAGILRLFKQPLIVSYILTGILVGPSFLNLISSTETINTLSHIGISLLLFTVGLSLNPKIIKQVGKVSLVTGVGQVLFTSIIGFFIATALGFATITAIYIAIALTFSSTIIIMKLLSDKGDSETLYGKIAIGFLLIQDLIVILVLMGVSSFSGEFNKTTLIFDILIKGFGLLASISLFGIYLLPKLIKSIAKSQEFLLLFSLSWCLSLASFSYYLGFSIEIGALLAGVTLAISPYRHEISSKMRPLRDFFIILFFVLLGSQMVFSDIAGHIIPILIFSIFILIGNPLIVIILMGLLGYTKRTSFLAGLTVAQISEFSLIFIALGVQVGHLDVEILSLVTIIGLLTITGSTYLILYADKIYPYFEKYLSIFEKKGKKIDKSQDHLKIKYDTILLGHNRIGLDILKTFKKIEKKFLVIDYNPETIKNLTKEGINCQYGDVDDAELLDELNLSKIKMAVSTIPKVDTNFLLITKIKEVNPKAIIIVISHQIDEALSLYSAGATYVLLPHFLGGRHIAAMIKKHELNTKEFLEIKEKHIKHLMKRKALGHEHPKHEKS